MRELIYAPLVLTLRFRSVRPAIERDVSRFAQPRLDRPLPKATATMFMSACRRREFRTVLYRRIALAGRCGKVVGRLLRVLYRPQVSFEIHCMDIGAGFFVQHGFSTIVIAERVGRDCSIGQQCTVGYSDRGGPPSLGDRVRVGAGAIIIGPVALGDDCVIGAGAVVVDDVPSGKVVAGVPARVIEHAADRFRAPS